MQRSRFDTWVGKIPWRREWLPSPVLLPGEFHDRGDWQATEMEIQEKEQTWVEAVKFELLTKPPDGGISPAAGWKSAYTRKRGHGVVVM